MTTVDKSAELLPGLLDDLDDMASISNRSTSIEEVDSLIGAYLAICAHWILVRRSEGIIVSPEFSLSYNSPLLQHVPVLKLVDANKLEVL